MLRALMRSVIAAALVVGLVLASNSVVCASGLQVAPVSLTIKASQQARGLRLSNTSDHVIHAQVRVYRWRQMNGEDRQEKSRGLVASPPLLTIQPGQEQLVRVIRAGPPPTGPDAVEKAYRLSIDELPIRADEEDAATPDDERSGLTFLLHYSVPVFVLPSESQPKPDLDWQLKRIGGHTELVVGNHGTGHAQLADVTFTDSDGTSRNLQSGLAGYVLPGSTMQWHLPGDAGDYVHGAVFKARINGREERQDVAAPVVH